MYRVPGADPGGGTHPARAPPKIGKNMIFWRKIVISHTKYPKNVRARVSHEDLYSVADPGFQVRGGALKKIAPNGGRREHFWGISCEKSRFYAKKSYFFQF
jgi:hypothetical protein